ncbi:MAG TPA: sortase, partial [Acidimicrobiales bacterium]
MAAASCASVTGPDDDRPAGPQSAGPPLTALDTRPDTVEEWEPELSAPVPAADDEWAGGTGLDHRPMTPGRVVLIVAAWLVVTFLSMMLVLYGLEPLFQERTQNQLLAGYRKKVEFASNETGGLGGVSTPVLAPELGSPVAIIEIGRLQVQQVVVEGAQPLQTQAGPGQPGNSSIVGRRGTFGAPFRNLDKLEPDDPILVTTTQGQSVYKVVSVQTQRIVPTAVDAAASS